ncbi:MAG: GntR family transcriptional regulator [Pyrinomonadaceae bacterium]
MEIKLQEASAGPVYAQVRDQIEAQIKSGALAPGTLLQAPAALANSLDTDTGEIQRAYFELVQTGSVTSRATRDFLGKEKTVYTVV